MMCGTWESRLRTLRPRHSAINHHHLARGEAGDGDSIVIEEHHVPKITADDPRRQQAVFHQIDQAHRAVPACDGSRPAVGRERDSGGNVGAAIGAARIGKVDCGEHASIVDGNAKQLVLLAIDEKKRAVWSDGDVHRPRQGRVRNRLRLAKFNEIERPHRAGRGLDNDQALAPPVDGETLWPIAVAMEGYNGHVRPLDSLVRARGWRLFNVNNLKLARFKEIFPAAAKSDRIDSAKTLELFQLRDHLPMAGDVLQEVMATPEENDILERLSRRRRRLVNERGA